MPKRFYDNPNVNVSRFATCVRRKDEIATQPNLAYTTGEMYNMWKNGVPIDNQNNVSMFDDGTTGKNLSLPLERRRGVDPADLWQAQMASRSKVRKAWKNGVEESKNE